MISSPKLHLDQVNMIGNRRKDQAIHSTLPHPTLTSVARNASRRPAAKTILTKTCPKQQQHHHAELEEGVNNKSWGHAMGNEEKRKEKMRVGEENKKSREGKKEGRKEHTQQREKRERERERGSVLFHPLFLFTGTFCSVAREKKKRGGTRTRGNTRKRGLFLPMVKQRRKGRKEKKRDFQGSFFLPSFFSTFLLLHPVEGRSRKILSSSLLLTFFPHLPILARWIRVIAELSLFLW